jgi:hypothetical protein
MSGPITPIVPKTNPKEQWYDEMLDEETGQLDFMMHNNTVTPLNLQHTTHINNNYTPSNIQSNEECTSCTRN